MKEFIFCARFHISWSDVLSICFYHSSSGQILTIKLDQVSCWQGRQGLATTLNVLVVHDISLTSNDFWFLVTTMLAKTIIRCIEYNWHDTPLSREEGQLLLLKLFSELWFSLLVRWVLLCDEDCVLKNHLSLKNCVCCQVADVLKIINELID